MWCKESVKERIKHQQAGCVLRWVMGLRVAAFTVLHTHTQFILQKESKKIMLLELTFLLKSSEAYSRDLAPFVFMRLRVSAVSIHMYSKQKEEESLPSPFTSCLTLIEAQLDRKSHFSALELSLHKPMSSQKHTKDLKPTQKPVCTGKGGCICCLFFPHSLRRKELFYRGREVQSKNSKTEKTITKI